MHQQAARRMCPHGTEIADDVVDEDRGNIPFTDKGCHDRPLWLLGRDHRRLDSILADAKRCLVAGDLPRASARFAEFRDGLDRHIAAEEEILFPAFEKLKPKIMQRVGDAVKAAFKKAGK